MISRLLKRCVVAALLLTLSTVALAADGTTADVPDAASQSTATQAPATSDTPAQGPDKSGDGAAASDPATKADGKAKGDPGDFIPTEEISEDYAVSFPVDI